MTILEEMATYLDTQGIGTYDTTGTTGTIFINFLPISPDECININLYGGQGVTSSRGYAGCKFDTALIQLYFRGEREDSLTPYENAQTVYDLFAGFHHKTLISGGTFIFNIRGNQSCPVFIGKDQNSRFEYVVNLIVEYQNVNKNY